MRNGGSWTEGRFQTFVTTALRRASGRWPPKYESLKEARTEKKTNPKTGRLAQFFRCNACTLEFTQKDVQVDHKEPIGKTDSWDIFIERLFCEKDNLQVLCTKCHKIKSKKERAK